MRLLSQSSTQNDGLETNTLSVSNPRDGNDDLTPAPPTNTLLQNEGVLNNLTPAPPTITALQNDGVVNNETTAPLNTSASQNEATSQHHTSHPEAEINIANNLASEFASESEPPTFE